MERLLKGAQKITGVEYDIDNLGDVYDAIHVIQGELGLTGVAADEAKTTLSGSAGAMKASWENLMGAMATGQGLDTAMVNLTDSVRSFATNVLTIIGNIGPQLPDLILGLADVVIDNAPAFVAAGAELIGKLIIGLVERIPEIAAKVPEIFKSFKAAFGAIDWRSLGNTLINLIGDGINAAKEALSGAMQRIGQAAKEKFQSIDWAGLARTVITKITTALGTAGSAIATKLQGLASAAKEKALSIDWAGLGRDIVTGIISGLKNLGGSLSKAVKDMIKNALKAGQDEAETGSPSRLFSRELGRWIPEGIAMGVDEHADSVELSVRNAVDDAVVRMQPASAVLPPAASSAGDVDRIIAALRELRLVADVRLDGDARQIFRVVKNQNNVRAKSMAYNMLGAEV